MAKNNKKLREILFALSTEDEKDGYLKHEKLEEVSNTAKEIQKKIEGDTSNEAIIAALKDLAVQVSKMKPQPIDHTPVVDAIRAMSDIVKNTKPQDLSGFFKDFAVQIAETGRSSKDTKDLITNLKWNSTMGIKNQNGTPISPYVSPFQVSDWNDVVLAGYDSNGNPGTITFKLGAQTVAIITLTYDGSGNLTEAKRN